MPILKSGLLYFALVFGVGFALGPIRVLWAVPRFGERTAELIEAPLMLFAIVLAARWLVRRVDGAKTFPSLLGVGGVALVLLLTMELTVVLTLRGGTFSEYVRSRDPVAGAVYVVLLLLYAAMPAVVRVLSGNGASARLRR